MNDASHVPVMLDEVLTALQPRDGGLYVDGTFGAGGYTRGILGAADCRVLGIDRDPSARETADLMTTAYKGRFAFGFGPFSMMEDIIEVAGSSGVDGVVLDLGVSSMQIDQAPPPPSSASPHRSKRLNPLLANPTSSNTPPPSPTTLDNSFIPTQSM